MLYNCYLIAASVLKVICVNWGLVLGLGQYEFLVIEHACPLRFKPTYNAVYLKLSAVILGANSAKTIWFHYLVNS